MSRSTDRVAVGQAREFRVGVAGFEPTASSSRTKRATKLRHTPLEATTAYRTPRSAGQTAGWGLDPRTATLEFSQRVSGAGRVEPLGADPLVPESRVGLAVAAVS